MPTIPQNYTTLNEPLFELNQHQQRRIPPKMPVAFRKDVRKGSKGKLFLVYVAEYFDESTHRFIYVASQQKGELDPNALETQRLLVETQRAAEEKDAAFLEAQRIDAEVEKFIKKTGWSQPSLLESEETIPTKSSPRKRGRKPTSPLKRVEVKTSRQTARKKVAQQVEQEVVAPMVVPALLHKENMMAGKVHPLTTSEKRGVTPWSVEQIFGGIAASAVLGQGSEPESVATWMAESQAYYAKLYGEHWSGAVPPVNVIKHVMMLYQEKGLMDMAQAVFDWAAQDPEQRVGLLLAQQEIPAERIQPYYVSPYQVAVLAGSSEPECQHLLLRAHPANQRQFLPLSWVRGLHLDRSVVTTSSAVSSLDVAYAVLERGGHYVLPLWEDAGTSLSAKVRQQFDDLEELQTFVWKTFASGKVDEAARYYWILPASSLGEAAESIPGLRGGSLVMLAHFVSDQDGVSFTGTYFLTSLSFSDPETPTLVQGALRSYDGLMQGNGYSLDIAVQAGRLEKRDPTVLACQASYETVARQIRMHNAKTTVGS